MRLAPLLALALTGVSIVAARPPYVRLIPNGSVNACASCHVNPLGGGPRNAFGEAFDANGRVWNATLAALDSDGDTAPNGQELNDPQGAWTQGAPNQGDARLVSSPGFPFSTPGERGIRIGLVLPAGAPGGADGPMVGLHNPWAVPVDASDLILFSGEQTFALPSGSTIQPGGILVVRIDGAATSATEVAEPAGIGLAPFNPAGDFVSLHWTGTPDHFTRPTTLIDYVQWGAAGQPLEEMAVQGGQWVTGEWAQVPPAGVYLRNTSGGNGSGAWELFERGN